MLEGDLTLMFVLKPCLCSLYKVSDWNTWIAFNQGKRNCNDSTPRLEIKEKIICDTIHPHIDAFLSITSRYT